MADWATLYPDILFLVAERIDFFEDFISFGAVCKSWQLVTSILKRNRTLPPRFPYVMLTDRAEKNYPKVKGNMHPFDMLVIKEVQKKEHIEGMHKRPFFSFSTSKTCEIELPEATRRKCIGVGYGWLLTIGYDLKINLLHPFTRQQIGMPPLLSFEVEPYYYDEIHKPETVVSFFVSKAVMSSNPYNNSNQDCVILAIYGGCKVLAFARPGDETWTKINVRLPCYDDVIFYKGKFYAIDCRGVVYVCDIDDEKGPKVTAIAFTPSGFHDMDQKYLVESSGSLLVVIRRRHDNKCEHREVLTDDEEDIDDHIEREPNYTIDFSIFRLEEWHDDRITHNYPYKLTKVNSLGDQTLFLGYNASVSLTFSKCIKANCIYYSEDNVEQYVCAPYGGGNDTGIFDVESNSVTLHYAAEFRSHLTPPIWFI